MSALVPCRADLQRADPRCKRCFGTGRLGWQRLASPDGRRLPIICHCVVQNGGVQDTTEPDPSINQIAIAVAHQAPGTRAATLARLRAALADPQRPEEVRQRILAVLIRLGVLNA
jgi:hypothetical protein